MNGEIDRYYRAVELEPGASLEQVKQAWREQVDGVGESVAARGARATDARQGTRLQLQGITQVIEPDAVGQLRLEQAHDVTPRLEGPGFILRPGNTRYLGDLVRRNVMSAECN